MKLELMVISEWQVFILKMAGVRLKIEPRSNRG